MIFENLECASGKPMEPVTVNKVDYVLLMVINNILEDIFGKKARALILQAMEKKYSFKWRELPDKVQVFSDALHEMLGKGSVIIEDLIRETVYAKLNVDFKWKEGYRFSDYINELRITTQKSERW